MKRRSALALLSSLIAAPTWALYDPKPNALLTHAMGQWEGALTYRDWSHPDKLVTLQCKMNVVFSGPEELTLYYVFNDGPGKTVYSYEKMQFDFAKETLLLISGSPKTTQNQYRLTRVEQKDDATTIEFERPVETRMDKFSFILTKSEWSLIKHEHSESGQTTFRNKYAFRRVAS